MSTISARRARFRPTTAGQIVVSLTPRMEPCGDPLVERISRVLARHCGQEEAAAIRYVFNMLNSGTLAPAHAREVHAVIAQGVLYADRKYAESMAIDDTRVSFAPVCAPRF